MSEAETLGILDEVEALVSDKLQVVSYKWLSRHFLVSSETAKRLLQEFVQSHEDGFQVVYSLSGRLKNNPVNYHVRLVPGPNLDEAKQDFSSCCSVEVYSVQACIPKDPATIRNAEFVQAAELFRQPSTVENCLRDNRFCGISNLSTKRNAEGTSSAVAGLPPSGLKATGSSSNSIHKNLASPSLQPNKVLQTNQKDDQRLAKDVKIEADASAALNQADKPVADKGKVTSLPTDKKVGQNNKNTAGAVSSLQNLWGRASSKSKGSESVNSSAGTTAPNSTATAQAEICAREAAQVSSDDEDEFNFRRTSNGEAGRKRRVVFDFSDEENEYEDAVNLASPDLPKVQSLLASKEDPLKEKKPKLDFDGLEEDKLKVKKEESAVNERPPEEIPAPATDGNPADSTSEKVQSSKNDSTGKTSSAAPTPASPKRRKILKTRIDERGREVTEVVWEGEEVDISKAETMKKGNNDTTTETGNRPLTAKKPPSAVPSGPSNAAPKAGNKKVGSKNQQGNILSFFKRV